MTHPPESKMNESTKIGEQEYLKHFIKMRVETAKNPPDDGMFMIYKCRYWATKDNEIYFFRSYTSPQCNSQLAVMKFSPLVTKYGFEIVLIDKVFVPHECEDYL